MSNLQIVLLNDFRLTQSLLGLTLYTLHSYYNVLTSGLVLLHSDCLIEFCKGVGAENCSAVLNLAFVHDYKGYK